MKKTDLAYAAGIIDGEGYIQIKKGADKRCRLGYTFQLKVRVSNTDEWLCIWLKITFGGSVCLTHLGTIREKPAWEWSISTRQAKAFLQLILPYLKLKQLQARLAIEFQSRKRHHPIKSDKQYAFEEAQYILLQKIKQRGDKL